MVQKNKNAIAMLKNIIAPVSLLATNESKIILIIFTPSDEIPVAIMNALVS